jgi:hypothetical protein
MMPSIQNQKPQLPIIFTVRTIESADVTGTISTLYGASKAWCERNIPVLVKTLKELQPPANEQHEAKKIKFAIKKDLIKFAFWLVLNVISDKLLLTQIIPLFLHRPVPQKTVFLSNLLYL